MEYFPYIFHHKKMPFSKEHLSKHGVIITKKSSLRSLSRLHSPCLLSMTFPYHHRAAPWATPISQGGSYARSGCGRKETAPLSFLAFPAPLTTLSRSSCIRYF